MDKDYLAALESHAEDNRSLGGEVITGSLTRALSFVLEWTSETWDDGVPVTKYFGRCEQELPLDLSEGQELAVMRFTGQVSEMDVCDFRVGRIWYRACGTDASELLESLVISPEQPD